MRRKIIIDDKIPYIKGALEPVADVAYLPGAKISRVDVKDADAIITRTRTECNRLLLHTTRVQFIATATIGFDHIDDDYCQKHGISWTNAPGCNSGSVKQYITSAILNLALKYRMSLSDLTLGVVGIGNVGSKVAQVGEALGMTVLKNDPPRKRNEQLNDFKELDEIIRRSDIITLHVPLNKEGQDKTFHLVEENFINQMKPTAILINSSRGPVVDCEILKRELGHRVIRGAVLDVWENEPDIDLELLAMLEYATPHIAGYSADGKANGTAMSIQAVSRFFDLGFDDWTVQNIPQPSTPEIIIPENLKTIEEKLCFAVNKSYDISFDTGLLRQSPQTFEKQRGDYRVRREFQAYEIVNPGEIKEIAEKLGFKTRS